MNSENTMVRKGTVAIILVAILVFAGAMLFFRTNIPGEAELLEAISEEEKKYGRDNPQMVTILSLVAAKYQLAGHPDKAIDIYKRIISIDEKQAGKESETVARSRHQLAILYDMAGDPVTADTIFSDICSMEKKLMARQQNVKKASKKSSSKAYKPFLEPWLKTRIIYLYNKHEKQEADLEQLSRYQERLKLCSADGGTIRIPVQGGN